MYFKADKKIQNQCACTVPKLCPLRKSFVLFENAFFRFIRECIVWTIAFISLSLVYMASWQLMLMSYNYPVAYAYPSFVFVNVGKLGLSDFH